MEELKQTNMFQNILESVSKQEDVRDNVGNTVYPLVNRIDEKIAHMIKTSLGKTPPEEWEKMAYSILNEMVVNLDGKIVSSPLLHVVIASLKDTVKTGESRQCHNFIGAGHRKGEQCSSRVGVNAKYCELCQLQVEADQELEKILAGL